MITRIRDRRSFARLASDGTRIRCSALWCSWCPDPTSTSTSVAFAITRAYGPAVRRNRLRRRVRAVMSDVDRRTTLPPGLMLIGPRRGLDHELTFDEVTRDVDRMVERIRACNG